MRDSKVIQHTGHRTSVPGRNGRQTRHFDPKISEPAPLRQGLSKSGSTETELSKTGYRRPETGTIGPAFNWSGSSGTSLRTAPWTPIWGTNAPSTRISTRPALPVFRTRLARVGTGNVSPAFMTRVTRVWPPRSLTCTQVSPVNRSTTRVPSGFAGSAGPCDVEACGGAGSGGRIGGGTGIAIAVVAVAPGIEADRISSIGAGGGGGGSG